MQARRSEDDDVSVGQRSSEKPTRNKHLDIVRQGGTPLRSMYVHVMDDYGSPQFANVS